MNGIILHHLGPSSFETGLDIFLTILIILSAALIFYKTKEIYELSEHKGLKYFRMGFLIIGISYIFQLFKTISMYFFSQGLIIPELRFIPELFILFYFIGLGYLFSSMFSKNIKEYQIYILTIAIFLISFLFRTKGFILLYGTILLLGLGIVSLIKFKKSKKKIFSDMYLTYILIFFSWLFTVFTRVFSSFNLNGRILSEILTTCVFMYILYHVLKKLK